MRKIKIGPQKGFQEKFTNTGADIALGGGAAGVGKTRALLMEPLRHHKVKGFGSIIFRLSYPEITVEGGLWDESKKLYPYFGGYPNKNDLQWNYLQYGSKLTFRHMANEEVLNQYQGSQIPFIGFDEFTHFTRKMFTYMLTRNRSACGVVPYMRMTCNPDPDSWVADFIEWWIDQDSGFPHPERAGVIRYFISDQDNFVWGNSKDEVIEKAPHVFDDPLFAGMFDEGMTKYDLVKSFTFIPGSIHDNKILLKLNPVYLANLLAQDEETKLRLLQGNWKVRTDKKQLFEFNRLNDMFSNIIQPAAPQNFYIVIDHARFGRDLCVIGTWHGWKCVRIDILPTSDTNDINKVIHHLRVLYRGIPLSQIIVDQDGIGVKDTLLDCHIFNGNEAEVPVKGEVRGYFNKRTQNYFMLAEKVNKAEMSVDLNNVYLHEKGKEPVLVKQIKVQGKTREVRELIKEDLRTVRYEDTTRQTKRHIRIVDKKAQKNALGGRSPDFGDMLMIRAEFEFIKQRAYLRSA